MQLTVFFFLASTNTLVAPAEASVGRVDANSKKRHRRIKSNHKSDQSKEDGIKAMNLTKKSYFDL
jgi:hypothetical protein